MKRFKPYSMVNLLQRFNIFITLFLLSIVFTFTLYSLHMVKKQFTASQQQTLNLYMSELDQGLEKIASSIQMYQLKEGDPDFSNLDSGDIYRKKTTIISDFSYDTMFLNRCDGLFFLDVLNDEYGYVFNSANSSENYNTRLEIMEISESIMRSSSLFNFSSWYNVEAGDHPYLLYLRWRENFCYGAWINTSTLLPSVSEFSSNPDTFLYLTDNTGRYLDSSAHTEASALMSQKSLITTSSASVNAPFTLSVSTPSTYYLSTMSASICVLAIISILVFFAIFLMNIVVKRIIEKPLSQVLSVIGRFESGDLNYVPSDQNMPSEIIHINQALHNMAHEIQLLKIDVYENELHLKDVQVQYLQHQIKPHFVINILNTIGLMAQMNEGAQIARIISNLSQYIRNTMNLTIRTTSLHHELEQLENYLALQRIRYPNQIDVSYHIDPQLNDFKIPILTIQTLVENIFKHALEPYVPLTIQICASIQQNTVVLSVHDNGCGFPQELIETFNQPSIPESDGQHIGLVNIRQRLNLEYPQASMHLSNDSGALVTITLPLRTSESL